MLISLGPKIEHWYEKPDGQTFRVATIDENDGSVEVVYFDGMLQEINIATWYALELRAIIPPKDWSGLFDENEAEDSDAVCFAVSRELEEID